MICPSCGEENPERFRLCGYCGAELPKVAPAETRKVVTLVFADVTGSTALGETLDPESIRWVMTTFFETAREVLERHGGTVEKFIGDAVMAAFGIPRVREDDALRGVRAAAELRDRLRVFGGEVEVRYGTAIGVRIGVNTGEVVAGDAAAGQAFASGDAVNVAARLEQAAAPGEVLIGEGTLRLVRDAVTVEVVAPLTLKGKSEPLPAWQLTGVEHDAPGVRRSLDAPLFGRTAELAAMLATWRRTLAERDAHLITLVAPAGTGKTRLLAEFAELARNDATVLVGHCLAYGEGITFWPIAEAIRQATPPGRDVSAHIARTDLSALVDGEDGAAEIVERLAPAVGLPGAPVPIEETFWAVRKLFEALARRRPLVVILDDVHWAEETLLDLIEYLAGWTRGVPLLLVCATRPELLERRAGIASPRTTASTLLLEPLAPGGAEELMRWQLGAESVSGAIRERVLAAAEGNPLFVQELVRMLVDDGVTGHEGAADGLAMPPTIQALLAARLDALDPGEREIAQRAAVVGHTFSWSALRALCDEGARGALSTRLHTLVRRQMIVPETGTGGADDEFRFGHVLVRDAAYAGLAKRTRAELHERFADWLGEARSDRLTEHEDIVGYHLEQAAGYRRELGEAGPADALAGRAAERLAAAGRRALAAGDLPAAANLLERAADVLAPGDPRRRGLRFEAIPALAETGRNDRFDAGLSEILGTPGEDDRRNGLRTGARAWRAFADLQRGAGTLTVSDVAASTWLETAELAGDARGQAAALNLLAKTRFWSGHAEVAEALLQRAAEQAELADDQREESEALMWLVIVAMYGPKPVATALELCDSIATRPGASRKVRAMASIERGVLEAMSGEIAEGRARVARGRGELDELGLGLAFGVTAQEAIIVEQMAGDADAAVELLTAVADRLRAMGESSFESTASAMVVRILHAEGRPGEAAVFAARTSADDDADVTPRAARALVAAARGELADAFAGIRAALTAVAASDFLCFHADCHVDLARICELAGLRTEMLHALASADALYLRKGCTAPLATTAALRARATA